MKNQYLHQYECEALISEQLQPFHFKYSVTITPFSSLPSMGDVWCEFNDAIVTLKKRDASCVYAFFICASNDDRELMHGHGSITTTLSTTSIRECISSRYNRKVELLKTKGDSDAWCRYILTGNRNRVVRDGMFIHLKSPVIQQNPMKKSRTTGWSSFFTYDQQPMEMS